jgi:hypothetical protein
MSCPESPGGYPVPSDAARSRYGAGDMHRACPGKFQWLSGCGTRDGVVRLLRCLCPRQHQEVARLNAVHDIRQGRR